MAVLSLRNVPDDLMVELNTESAARSMTLREYCLQILNSRGGMPKAPRVDRKIAAAVPARESKQVEVEPIAVQPPVSIQNLLRLPAGYKCRFCYKEEFEGSKYVGKNILGAPRCDARRI